MTTCFKDKIAVASNNKFVFDETGKVVRVSITGEAVISAHCFDVAHYPEPIMLEMLTALKAEIDFKFFQLIGNIRRAQEKRK